MVLVDTSVWIRFLSNRAPYGTKLDRLLAEKQVATHDLIYGELLIGDSGGRRELLEMHQTIRKVPVIPHSEVIAFVRSNHLHGRGIGWIDAHLLASALVSNIPLWTADARLAVVCAELGVHY